MTRPTSHGNLLEHSVSKQYAAFSCAKTARSKNTSQQPKQSQRRAERIPGLRCRAEKQPEGDSRDFIERMVGAIFGKKALEAAEPFGMKRMSDEAYNEQSVATITELAALMEGDSPEVALFRPLLAKTRLESKPLRYEWRLYHCHHACKTVHYIACRISLASHLVQHFILIVTVGVNHTVV